MKKAPPEKQQLHDAVVNNLWDNYKKVEKELSKTMPFDKMFKHPDYQAAVVAWRVARNTCPACGSTNTAVENHDLNWHDGDVTCSDCGTYVRMYDAG